MELKDKKKLSEINDLKLIDAKSIVQLKSALKLNK